MTDPFDALDPEKDSGDIDYGAEFEEAPATETEIPQSSERLYDALFGVQRELNQPPEPPPLSESPIAIALAGNPTGLSLVDQFSAAELADYVEASELGSKRIDDMNLGELALIASVEMARAHEGMKTNAQIAQDEQDALDEATAEPSIFEALSPSEFNSLVKTLKQGASLSESTLSRADQKALRAFIS